MFEPRINNKLSNHSRSLEVLFLGKPEANKNIISTFYSKFLILIIRLSIFLISRSCEFPYGLKQFEQNNVEEFSIHKVLSHMNRGKRNICRQKHNGPLIIVLNISYSHRLQKAQSASVLR